jgi:TonB family protein
MTTLVAICGQPLVHALGWTLLHLCWQGTGVAVVLWCVLKVLDGRSSRARYAAACLALGLMVALPLATFAHLAAAEYRQRAALDDSAVVIDPGMVLRVEAGETSALLSERIAVALNHALPWVLLAWFAGVIFFAVRLNVGLLVARRMRSVATTAAPAELQHAFDALRRRLGIARAVRLMHSALVQVPTVIGWLRPVVLVPASCLTGLSAMQIEAILAHELAHIRRHDYLVSVLQSVIETVLFYHPAVWWVSKQVRRERECCCDELAVAVGGDRLAYARALSALEERRSYSPEFVLGANGGVLTMRIKRLLGCKESSAASQLVSIALLAALVLAAGAVAGKLAHAQNGTAQTNSSASSTAQVTVVPDARQSAVVSAVMGSTNGTHPLLSTAGQQTTSDTERKIENAQRQLQFAQEQLNSEQFKKEIEDAQRWLQNAQAKTNSPEFKKQIEDVQLRLQDAQKKLNSEQFKKQIEDAQRQLQDAQKNTNSAQFKKQMEGAQQQLQDAQKKLNSEQFKKQLEDVQRQLQDAQKKLNSEQFKGQIAQLLAQNAPAGQQPGASPKLVAPPPPPSSALPQGPVRVSSGTLAGMLLTKPAPVYPEEAKVAHVQGAVVLHAIISKTGTVENLHVISGSAMLVNSAIDAVQQWTYKPYLLNGQPVEVETSITVNYTLADSTTVVGQSPAADDASAGVEQIGGDVKGPVIIYEPEPEYTAEAKKAKFSGFVTVSIIVDKNGIPQNVHVTRGVGLGLDEKAVEAVKQYKFKPATENGKPVAVYLNVEVNFEIF